MKLLINKQKALRLIVGLMAVILIFTAGIYAHIYYQAKQIDSAKATAQAFVQDLVTGKIDSAYGLTAKSLQSKQTKTAFTTAIGNVKSDKPSYGDAQYMMRDGKFYYTQRALNLPKTDSGSTTGDFILVLTYQGTAWRVETVAIQ